MTETKKCPFCGVVMDPDSEGVPAHPVPLCADFMTQNGEIRDEDEKGCE